MEISLGCQLVTPCLEVSGSVVTHRLHPLAANKVRLDFYGVGVYVDHDIACGKRSRPHGRGVQTIFTCCEVAVVVPCAVCGVLRYLAFLCVWGFRADHQHTFGGSAGGQQLVVNSCIDLLYRIEIRIGNPES